MELLQHIYLPSVRLKLFTLRDFNRLDILELIKSWHCENVKPKSFKQQEKQSKQCKSQRVDSETSVSFLLYLGIWVKEFEEWFLEKYKGIPGDYIRYFQGEIGEECLSVRTLLNIIHWIICTKTFRWLWESHTGTHKASDSVWEQWAGYFWMRGLIVTTTRVRSVSACVCGVCGWTAVHFFFLFFKNVCGCLMSLPISHLPLTRPSFDVTLICSPLLRDPGLILHIFPRTGSLT